MCVGSGGFHILTVMQQAKWRLSIDYDYTMMMLSIKGESNYVARTQFHYTFSTGFCLALE